MSFNLTNILTQIPQNVLLIVVSKTRSVEEILKVHNAGVHDFGENKVQELLSKQPLLPADINWHLIGHLQTNKVKYIAPFVHLIHSVDSLKLLLEINNQGIKNNRVIDCLLQVYIAKEDTKFGLDLAEIETILSHIDISRLSNVRITGLMGMATFTDNMNQVRLEFQSLKEIFNKVKTTYFPDKEYFSQISMGMSGDYKIAIEEGSTMVRIGTAIFGERKKI